MMSSFQELSSAPAFLAAFIALIAFGAVLLLVPVILRLAPVLGRRTEKEFHQTHKHPVPRFGGLALACVFIVVAPFSLYLLSSDREAFQPRLTVLLASLAMFALGFWDDLSPLGARKKLLGQILIACAAYFNGLEIGQLREPFSGTIYHLGWLGFPVTVFWLVAFTNLINLVDGIDGLAGGISLMLMALIIFSAGSARMFSLIVAAAMAGALLGFLRYNFPPARIYLGDGGAYFLGFLIGALAIQNSHKGTVAAALIAPVLALALPILDVSFSILRRGLKGLPVFRADRGHIHHRLIRSGHSSKRAVLILYGVSLLFLILGLIAFASDGRLAPILFGCVFLVVLVMAPSFGIIGNWLTVGTAIGNSVEMRREVQYALLLRRWLQLEAERCDTVEELWADLHYIARKLGFCELTVTDGSVRHRWASPTRLPSPDAYVARQEIHVEGRGVIIEVRSFDASGDERQFIVLSELLAETWMKASVRWRRTHSTPFHLAPEASEPAAAAAQSAGSSFPA